MLGHGALGECALGESPTSGTPIIGKPTLVGLDRVTSLVGIGSVPSLSAYDLSIALQGTYAEPEENATLAVVELSGKVQGI